MIPVKRLEIVIDAPHAPRIVELLESSGLKGWTLIKNAVGAGERGRQHGDEITGVSSNHVILCACSETDFDAIRKPLRSLLTETGGMCLISDVYWLRH